MSTGPSDPMPTGPTGPFIPPYIEPGPDPEPGPKPVPPQHQSNLWDRVVAWFLNLFK